MNWLEKLDMGKYALYVWGSFGMAAFCLILEPLMLYISTKKVRKGLKQIDEMEQE
tara:strand:+ start:2391 stop:2555 length:165 start_codon:yes stop_codon:yes gene_type:complete